MTKKRVVLINPKTVNKYYHLSFGWLDRLFVWFFKTIYDRRFDIPSHTYCTTMPPITLFALEALFHDRCEATVIDEQVDAINFERETDLVCVTATTPQVPRAYEIARHFRARGVPTAIGGVHATCLPDECARHFDTVCIGEAEGYIEDLLRDLMQGRLQPRYVNRATVSMEQVPFYRYETGTGKYLPFHVINYSRGCVFKCDYCSIQSTLGSFRTRSLDQIVKEIQRVGSKHLWFPDATLTANPHKARELFKALTPLKVRWLGQITLNVAKDEAMLDQMAESGCWLAGIGFDSLSNLNIRTARKVQNRVEDYARVIRALHDRNIAIEGNFVFGFDEDRDRVFDDTARFAVETGVDLPEFYVLTPYPDTELYRRWLAEGRIVDFDWSHYDNTHFQYLPVYQPRHMTREALREGCRRAERKVYSPAGTLRRLSNSRLFHVPVLIANLIYTRRLAHRRDLIPEGESAQAVSVFAQEKNSP
jgi:radical SAM superfamily enzyme YgiQ (UPF0313 family)